MIRKSLSILFLILSVLTLYAEKTNYLYSFNSDLNEGISQLSVMTIYQDSRGYLWFATKNPPCYSDSTPPRFQPTDNPNGRCIP